MNKPFPARLFPALLLALVFFLPRPALSAVSGLADFRELIKTVGPAVVNVSTERTARFRGMPFPFDDDFFFPFRPNMPHERRQSSLGSGFIISDDGYVVTNNHVVEGAEVIRVNFDSSRNRETSYEAKVIGTDKETDLALLKIEASQKLPFARFGDSDALEVGEWVVAIGNPLGLDHTVTAGILSAKFRNIDSSSLVRFLQTDASINPGNSGGPLLNMRGEVIGINTAIASQAQGIGFAIPSSLAREIIENLRTDRKVSRGWLGVTIQPVDPATAKALGLPEAKGALIGGIIPNQPAALAGLEPGDVILKIDDMEIRTPDELQQTIMRRKPGETVAATVWRENKSVTFQVKLVQRDLSLGEADAPSPEENADNTSLGLQLRPVNEQEASRLRLAPRQGLMVARADPDKLGAKAGIRRGDVILGVGRRPVRSVEEFNKEVNALLQKQGAVILQINRGGNTFIISITNSK